MLLGAVTIWNLLMGSLAASGNHIYLWKKFVKFSNAFSINLILKGVNRSMMPTIYFMKLQIPDKIQNK